MTDQQHAVRDLDLSAFIRGANPPADIRVIARRDHNWISVAVVEYTDGEVWVAWTDGPRAEAEQVESLAVAMRGFAESIIGEVNDEYFEVRG